MEVGGGVTGNRKGPACSDGVAAVTRGWADRAHVIGIDRGEVELMSSAFEHDDLRLALEG